MGFNTCDYCNRKYPWRDGEQGDKWDCTSCVSEVRLDEQRIVFGFGSIIDNICCCISKPSAFKHETMICDICAIKYAQKGYIMFIDDCHCYEEMITFIEWFGEEDFDRRFRKRSNYNNIEFRITSLLWFVVTSTQNSLLHYGANEVQIAQWCDFANFILFAIRNQNQAILDWFQHDDRRFEIEIEDCIKTMNTFSRVLQKSRRETFFNIKLENRSKSILFYLKSIKKDGTMVFEGK